MPKLFITGGSGFIGSRLLRQLRTDESRPLVCLTRRPERPPHQTDGCRQVAGDLNEPAAYERELDEDTTVVHLAAVTGKASARQFRRVNVDGTGSLLRACVDRRVERVVLVSSIAAGFQDLRHYHYAESKIAAEALVRSSGLPFLILRPTMVLGGGSPVLEGLARLASLPGAGLVIGPGTAQVQPIHVDDLAHLLAWLVRHDTPGDVTVDAGGPERLSIEALLRRIRERITGHAGPMLRAPAGPLRTVLALLERGAGRLLPLTAGQLASFVNDGTAAHHPLTERFTARMRGIDDMLSPCDA